MRPLSDTITRLAALRASPAPGGTADGGTLTPLLDFGSNPGALGAWYHLPEGAGRGAPLVVVLHGCTQNAAGYDLGSGWSQLADEQGFAVLYPEQRRANNANLCFNWFEPGDIRRDSGEAESIAQMIEALCAEHGLDRSRVYVTGLSAGGAMASVMLAAYPELFAGGAIIAGLAFGTATNIPQALERMRGRNLPGAAALTSAVRGASPHRGPWPTISIWHGAADHVVVPANADAILAQWQGVHGIAGDAAHDEMIDGHAHRQWRGDDGRVMIEEYRIAGMAHGTPLATSGVDACGAAGPHMLEAGISSTRRIAEFWQLPDSGAKRAKPRKAPALRAVKPAPKPIASASPETPRLPAASGPTKIIEDALRAAGLMR